MSTGHGVAGGALEGDSVGQIAATGMLGAAGGGVGVAMKAANVVGKTAEAVDLGYSVGGHVGGAAIGGWG
ncbi:hypothetical protein [Streptomyces luteogriseus]|uniref:hypothetical protein n=1 Tax=Streptomyces luteogriseus TaxID=68233 RepID=UPI002602F0C1|nr:hypothetical protein [uncultured Streptomyces sp.]